MPWVRMDDAFLDNHKVILAGPLATHLYIAGLIWTNHALTDGWIPAKQLRRLVDWDGVLARDEATGEVAEIDPAALAKTLVDVGLWDPFHDGWTIHDYEKYQPQSEAAVAKRKQISAKRSAAGKKGAAKRWSKANDGNCHRGGVANGKQDDSPGARSPGPEARLTTGSKESSSLTATSTAVVAREESEVDSAEIDPIERDRALGELHDTLAGDVPETRAA